MTTTFSTVIVTRNRADALALSLPLHLGQSRLPERVLIVDSSDNPSANRALVAGLAKTAPVPVEHQVSAPGMTVQRNIGLAQVDSDVVFFPDDDSLVHPGALERMMRIYDRDTEGRIGGVGGAEVTAPPEGVLPARKTSYDKRPVDRLRARIAPLRKRLEEAAFPDPMVLAAARLQARMDPPEPWLEEEDAARVEWITGFRMSFRTEAVRRVGFNEHLGRYALYEDIDAGLGVQAGGQSLVVTNGAKIYHHKAPETRANGRQMGMMNILNRAYVVLRGGATDPRVRSAIRSYGRFRTAQFALGARGPYGRDRLVGARAAMGVLPELFAAPAGELDETYVRLRRACMEAG